MASSVITPKKSVLLGAVPSSESLSFGEIAINHADKKLYAKHPSTGAIQEIGSLSAHSHDELYSLDNSQHIELQDDGTLVVTAGSTSKTLTLPGASGTLATLNDITAGGGGGGGVQANWASTSGPSSILNKPTLATVATSGSYTDLSSKPALGTAAATDSTDSATAAQGAKADSALQASALTPYRTSADQDTIDAGKATSAQGAKADSASQPGHGHSLSDISVSGATNGQVPAWNGTAWAPSTPAASGVSSVAGRTGAVTLAVTDVANAVGSVTTGANSTQITNMMQITQGGYNALGVNVAANTLYIIVG